MDTKAVLAELATASTMTLPEEIMADRPLNIQHWAEVVAHVANQLIDYDFNLDMEDMTTMFEEISNPNDIYPYYKDKWEAMGHFTAWASSDLMEEAHAYCEREVENEAQPDYLFLPVNGYIFALYQSACLSILTYCQKLAGQA